LALFLALELHFCRQIKTFSNGAGKEYRGQTSKREKTELGKKSKILFSRPDPTFFLYPYLLQIRDQTGQMIDPQGHTDFTREMLPVVIEKLKEARKSAESRRPQISVHVGKQFTPVAKELYEDVSRSKLLRFITKLVALFEDASAKSCRLILMED
jgi:hypothetical protein